MTTTFKKIKAGLEDAIAYEKGDKSRARVETRESPVTGKKRIFYKPRLIEIKEFRKKYHLTQKRFAEFLCVSTDTVSKWEQKRTDPSLIVLRLLSIIQKHPEIIQEEFKTKQAS
jgi:DNA-binding transcriptional regulator YiaG